VSGCGVFVMVMGFVFGYCSELFIFWLVSFGIRTVFVRCLNCIWDGARVVFWWGDGLCVVSCWMVVWFLA